VSQGVHSQSHGHLHAIWENPGYPNGKESATLTCLGAGLATSCRHDRRHDHGPRRVEVRPREQGHHRLGEVLRILSGWAGASGAELPRAWCRFGPSSELRSRSCQWEYPERPRLQRAVRSQQPDYLGRLAAAGYRPGQPVQPEAPPVPASPVEMRMAVLVHLQDGQALEMSVGTKCLAVLEGAPERPATPHY
jgi:hypothetical protein